jgi:hypothetical protein
MMRVSRLLLLVASALACNVRAQTTTPPASQDLQAVAVLDHALAAAGGALTLKAVTEYAGTGNITYHWKQDVQGTVTIYGKGGGQVRIDANLPAGIRSWVVNEGQTSLKAENGTVSQFPPQVPVIPSSDAFPYQAPMFADSLIFPYGQLVAVLNNPLFNISYAGILQLDGHSVHDVQIRRTPPNQSDPSGFFTQYHTVDVFIDTTSFQIVMTQDNVPKNVVHQVHYSAYAPVNGLFVPFSISEEMGGQQTWDIQIAQIRFNTGLPDSTFVLQ